MSDQAEQQRFRTLMREAEAGSEDAARELYDTYMKYVLRCVRNRLWHRLRSKFDSQDFVQQVWASFFDDRGSLPDFQSPEDLIAYLQAIEPENSPFSHYRLYVMDADGSNARPLFPSDDQAGLTPGAFPTWSPDGRLIAIVSSGNLWLIDPKTGLAQQVTGDSLTVKIDWR